LTGFLIYFDVLGFYIDVFLIEFYIFVGIYLFE